MAQEHGINANLLRKWITKYLMEREKGVSLTQQDNGDDRPPSGDATDSLATDPPSSHQLVVAAAPPAFVPVVSVPPASTRGMAVIRKYLKLKIFTNPGRPSTTRIAM